MVEERLVDPERRVRGDAAELKLHAFPPPSGRHEEAFAVVSPAAFAVALFAVLLRVEAVLDGPVVRQIDGTVFLFIEIKRGERPDDVRRGGFRPGPDALVLLIVIQRDLMIRLEEHPAGIEVIDFGSA